MIKKSVLTEVLFSIFAFLLLTQVFVVAQPNYLHGYIITNVGDTTFGFIDFQEWNETPDSIFFKEDMNLNSRAIGAGDIKGFSVGGEKYKSEEVNIDLTPRKRQQHYPRKATTQESIRKRVFLHTLVQSEWLSLLRYKGNRENFYVMKNGVITELISHVYLVKRGGEYMLNTNNSLKYLRQLRELNYNCRNLIGDSSPAYRAKSLIKYVTNCNEYVGMENNYIFTPQKIVVKHGVVFGAATNSFDVFYNDQKIKYNFLINYTFGYSADFVLPRDRGKRVINAQLTYNSFEAESNTYDHSFYAGRCNEDESDCRILYHDEFTGAKATLRYLDLKVLYSYRFSANDFSPKIMIGGSVSKLLSSETNTSVNRRILHVQNNDSELVGTSGYEIKVFDPQNILLNVQAGLGIEYKNYSLSLIYQPYPEMLKKYTYKAFYLLAKYSFN